MQKEFDSKDFTADKFSYGRRKNIIVVYRGLQFLIERKFQIHLNMSIEKKKKICQHEGI